MRRTHAPMLWVISPILWVIAAVLVPIVLRAEETTLTVYSTATAAQGPSTHVRVVLEGQGEYEAPAACQPGEACEVVVDLPTGCWVAQLQARNDVLGWSDPLSSRRAVCTPIGRHDVNGDGRVTTLDYSSFLRAFVASAGIE